MASDTINLIGDRIQGANTVAIVSHIRPDGDAIGAMLGLTASLEGAGKTVHPLLSDGLPASFRHLPGSQNIRKQLKFPVNLTFALDCADLPRAGTAMGDRMVDINIDHHITNQLFGELNLVDADAVATSEIIARCIPAWNIPMPATAAACLLSGIISDTIGFRTPNTNANTLRLAADLMEYGANLTDLYHEALIRRSYEGARYWGFGLQKLQRQGGLVWTSLTLNDRKASGYSGNDDADLVNIVSAVEGGDISVVFIEQKPGVVKVSWRAQPGYNVSGLAVRYGGGGHAAAAGATIEGTTDDVMGRVLRDTRNYYQTASEDNQLGNNQKVEKENVRLR